MKRRRGGGEMRREEGEGERKGFRWKKWEVRRWGAGGGGR